jgi:hypothetical protein
VGGERPFSHLIGLIRLADQAAYSRSALSQRENDQAANLPAAPTARLVMTTLL